MILDDKKKVYKIDDRVFHCGTAVTFHFFGGKWKSVILWYLRHGVLRFSEIKKLIPDITDKMLSIQLSALESDQLVKRKTHGTKPPYRVEYALTDVGRSLIPVIEAITKWGIDYAERNGELVTLD
ncbi:MAG: helix-turn-helix transcriptional regulator [Flavobacteriales bacterium]|nr:helix-turn-helix transcriptional regulator [Flavobacteriales bacterium]